MKTLGQFAYETLQDLIDATPENGLAGQRVSWGELDPGWRDLFEKQAEAIGLEYAERKDLHG